MAKLVILSEGLAGRIFDVGPEKTSVGRLDDNKICIPEPSVSSHHCELNLKGDEIQVRDLNSTNGTFINGDPVKEGTLKPGQILRLGIIELRYETGKRQDQARSSGVKLGDTGQTVPIEKNTAFSKKSNKANKIFMIVGAILAVAIIALLIIAFSGVSGR